jgi:hypothetical protein
MTPNERGIRMIGKIKSHLISLSTIALVVVLTSAAIVNETDEVVGSVSKLKGSAIAIQDAVPRILQPKSAIFMGDVISTGKDSRLEIVMIDDALFNLGARTNFVVEEYFLKEDTGNAAIRLLSGAVAVVTGKIASLDSRPFALKTATATIGVRGDDQSQLVKESFGIFNGCAECARWAMY